MARKVAVVGAGLAGLAAAWELSRRGCEVVLLERGNRAGGRLVAERREGFSLEPASGLLSSADSELLAWIGQLGLRDELLPLRPVVTAQVRDGRIREIDARGLLGVARIAGVRPHQALRLLRLPRLLRRYARHIVRAEPERAAPLDDRSLADFGRLYFGQSVLERWLAPLVTGPCLADERGASRALFLRRFVDQRDTLPGLPRGALAELPQVAAERLGAHLAAGVEEVVAVGSAVDLAVSDRGRLRRLACDAAVIATAAPDAARIAGGTATPAERDFFAGVQYAPGLFLSVALHRPLSLHPQLVRVPRGEDSPIETLLLEPGVRGGRVPERSGLVSLAAGSAWSEASSGAPDGALEKALLEALERLLPCRNAVRFTRLVRQARARPRFDVGHYRNIARFENVQKDLRRSGRRCYFAGDYLMDPSWSGAVLSGQRAARALAADLGVG